MMKRIVSGIAAAAFLLGSAIGASAQKYEPRGSWPYLYKDFTEGVVNTSSGPGNKGEFNIDVYGKLHFISNDGKIMEAKMAQVVMAKIGEDTYFNRGGRMAKIISRHGSGALILKTEPNYAQMDQADVGYGMKSSTSATKNVAVIQTEGTSFVNMELKAVTGSKDEGEVVPLKQTYYFLVNGMEYEAERYVVSNIDGIDKAALKAFLKAEKIKWNKVESLEKVLDFIMEQTASE